MEKRSTVERELVARVCAEVSSNDLAHAIDRLRTADAAHLRALEALDRAETEAAEAWRALVDECQAHEESV